MNTCSICPKPSVNNHEVYAYVNCIDGRHIDIHAKAILHIETQDRGEFGTVETGGYGGCIPGLLCQDHYIQVLESLIKNTREKIERMKP